MSGDSVHPPGWTFPLKPCQSSDSICCFALLLFPQESGAAFGFVRSIPEQPQRGGLSLTPQTLQGKDLYTQGFYKLVIRHRGNESSCIPQESGENSHCPASNGFCSPCSAELSVPSQSTVKIKGLCFSASGNVYGDYIFQLEIWRLRFLVSDMISVGWSQKYQGYV